MRPGPVTPGGAPRWRTLAWLAALVLLAHALVLRTHPDRFGAPLDTHASRAPVFETRRIELPPPAPTPDPANPAAITPRAPPPAQAAPKPPPRPVYQQKSPLAHAAPVQPAIDSIASSEREPEPEARADTLPPTLPDSAPATSPEETSDTAPPPTPAASAAAASLPPPGSAQTPITALRLPPSARLDYKMTGSAKGLTYHAKGELDWHNAGTRYDARMTVSALFIGSRTLSSTGQIGDDGLAPTRFADKSKNEVAAHFEPDKGQISFSANTPTLPWLKGSQDRVSVFLQLGGMLAGEPAKFAVGSTLAMHTIGPRDADDWTFLVEKQELLSLPFGDVATVKLSRQPRRDFDQKVEIWYAPALDYLPVRSRITQANGDFVDQQLSALARP
ncbi:MAG: DUF3108 domain-containing protein [Polaromonas sp.]